MRIKPNKVNAFFTEYVNNIIDNQYYFEDIKVLKDKGWKFFATNTKRGMCYYDKKLITIPTWVFNSCKTKLIWYICHEAAHVYAGPENNHNNTFMEYLMLLCPENCQHWEYEYKPRNAAMAGVSNKKD